MRCSSPASSTVHGGTRRAVTCTGGRWWTCGNTAQRTLNPQCRSHGSPAGQVEGCTALEYSNATECERPRRAAMDLQTCPEALNDPTAESSHQRVRVQISELHPGQGRLRRQPGIAVHRLQLLRLRIRRHAEPIVYVAQSILWNFEEISGLRNCQAHASSVGFELKGFYAS